MTDKKINILLVDDDADYLLQKKIELESEGFNIITANGRVSAHEIISNNKIDIAIVDLMMDERDDGFVLSFELKNKFPTLPIIMVTGVTAQTGLEFNTITQTEKKWIKADTIITKPVRKEQLIREIRRLLHV